VKDALREANHLDEMALAQMREGVVVGPDGGIADEVRRAPTAEDGAEQQKQQINGGITKGASPVAVKIMEMRRIINHRLVDLSGGRISINKYGIRQKDKKETSSLCIHNGIGIFSHYLCTLPCCDFSAPF